MTEQRSSSDAVQSLTKQVKKVDRIEKKSDMRACSLTALHISWNALVLVSVVPVIVELAEDREVE